MTLTTALLALVALLVGVGLGWSMRATRSATELAAARAEAQALRSSHELAARSLESASEDAARRQSSAIGAQVNHLVDPLRTTLGQLSEELRRVERNRINAYAGLSEQVRGMHQSSDRLQDQTRALADALRTPHIRGRWGEMQLERVAELAGMSRHCDFSTQVSGSSERSGDVRPDMVVHMAGGRQIVVDAKVPLHAYLDAAAASDPEQAAQALLTHARALRGHVNQLSSKAYWTAFEHTPELVVLFLPSDPVLEAALRSDPDLLEYSFTRNVVLSTPATLIALLRTVALGWRHDAMARDAATIHALGVELYQRLDSVLSHVDKLGGSLRRATEAYNTVLGVIDSRVGATARRLSELEGLGDLGTPTEPHAIDTTVRESVVRDRQPDADRVVAEDPMSNTPERFTEISGETGTV